MVIYTEILSGSNGEEQRNGFMGKAGVPIYSCASVTGDRATEREKQGERKKRKGRGREEGRKERRKKERKRRKKKKEAIFRLAETFRAFKLVTR